MNTEEFKKKFLPLSRRLYIEAWNLTANKEDAEDIVQECYIKLWKKRNSLEHVINVEAYAVTLVKHLCFDNHTDNKKICVEMKDNLSAVNDDTTENKDVLNHVRRFINELPEQQKSIIMLREIECCSFNEIEKQTGISQGNIRVLLSRARKRIREEFNKLLSNENR